MFKEKIAQHDTRKLHSIQTKNCPFKKKKFNDYRFLNAWKGKDENIATMNIIRF